MNIYAHIAGDEKLTPESLKDLHTHIAKFFNGQAPQISLEDAPEDAKIIVVNQNGLPENVYSNIGAQVLPPIHVCDLDDQDTEKDFEENPNRKEALELATLAQNHPAFRVVD